MELAAAPGIRPGWRLVSVWRAALLLGLATLAIHFAVGFEHGSANPFFNQWVYDSVEILAAAGCLVRGITVRAERSAWLWIGVALSGMACGDFLFDAVYHGDPPFPSIADAGFLVFYPAMYIGIGLLLRDRVSRFGASLWLDGLTAATAAAAVGAAVLVRVVSESTHGSPLVVVTNLAYPVGDLLLLALVVFVFSVSGWRPGRAWALIGAGLLVAAVGDSAFLYKTATDSYIEGTLLDLSWPLSLSLLALASWQAPARARRVALEQRTLHGTPIVCGLTALLVLLAAAVGSVHPSAVVLAALTIVLVLARMALTFRENSILLARSRSEALTDSLTGLANRRSLLNDLTDALEHGREQEPLVLALFDLDGFKQYNDSFGHPAGDALLARLADKLAATVAPHGRAYRMGGDEFCVLLPGSEELLDAAVDALTEYGTSFAVTSSVGSVTIPSEATSVSDALSVADERLYREKHHVWRRLSAAHEPLLRTLAEREPVLRAHVDNVSELAVAVGRRVGLGQAELEELRLAAELHDVGKLAIPDAVLQKPGPLDETEWRFIHEHTIVGQRILAGSPALAPVAAVVRSTHERWDGAGYPDGLAGAETALAARIITVCDAYSAILSDRPYRPARTEQEAVAEIRRCAGTQFDPALVEILCAVIADLRAAGPTALSA